MQAIPGKHRIWYKCSSLWRKR